MVENDLAGSIDSFREQLSFEPDSFQVEAFESLTSGNSVIVSAPTGAGKTLVAEFAVHLMIETGKRIFYTAPIKALSNQKYGDLTATYGFDKIGLLTGDTSINADAQVVVMTTEVLRNMIYESRDFSELGCVVLDEVHFLQDKFRGAVWEEVIINLDTSVQLVALSATVSNADQLQQWFSKVRGETDLVITSKRPVPLKVKYLVASKGGGTDYIDAFHKGKPNRAGYGFDRAPARQRRKRSGGKQKRYFPPRISETIATLSAKQHLPCIYFKFSRQGCEDEAKALVNSGVALRSHPKEVDALAEDICSELSDSDKEAIKYETFIDQLSRGVGVHHAGLVPQLKQLVETCFNEGYLDVVIATETLALGVNMPARAVVIDKLTKYNGETHELLTPSQFSQLSGRAGRRGLDTLGTAVVLWSPFVDFAQVVSLVGSSDFKLESSFRPNYNMAANLVRMHTEERAEEILGKSFAQHLIQRDLSIYEKRLDKLDRRRAKLSSGNMSSSDHKRIKKLDKQSEVTSSDKFRAENLLVDQFRKVRTVMEHFDFLDDWELTSLGESLVRIYHESDLLICLALDRGLVKATSVPELAAILSAFCYEERRRDIPATMWYPTPEVRGAVDGIAKLSREVNKLERRYELTETREPDAGFIAYIHHWASGGELSDISEDELSVGDFYRTVKKVVDLAKSLRGLDPQMTRLYSELIETLDRGVIRTARLGVPNAD